MKVYILYAITLGYFEVPVVRAIYLDSKSARSEAARLNASSYTGRRNKFVVKAMTAKGEKK
jgi:hypothetical protein